MGWDLFSSGNRWINKKTKAGTDGKIETKWNAATGQDNIFETVDTAVKHLLSSSPYILKTKKFAGPLFQ